MTKKRKRVVRPKAVISWVWEDDDPAARPCEPRHIDYSDQSIPTTELTVYDSLIACLDQQVGEGEDDVPGVLDETLANILVLADDFRSAIEWLTSEGVSHADEQGRRAGQRRRHLKERGEFTNGMRFVQLCGEWITTTDAIAVSAARQCIDDWEEIGDHRSLHFHKEEAGVRWEPCSAENSATTTMHLANPFCAPPATPEDDGRTVTQYHVELVSDEDGYAERSEVERSRWTSETDESEEEAAKGGVRWRLNQRAESAMKWLAGAAELAAEIAGHSDEDTLRRFFPSLREIQRKARRAATESRAAATAKTPQEAVNRGRHGGQTIH